MNTFLIFSCLTVFNVIFATVKSITTIKCNKLIASTISAFYYGYYNIVLIYTVADFPLYQKVIVTALCNLFGVYFVKWLEEKAKKDKLWKVEATVPINEKFGELSKLLEESHIPHNTQTIEDYQLFNCYCATKKESEVVKYLLDKYHAKYFVIESQDL